MEWSWDHEITFGIVEASPSVNHIPCSFHQRNKTVAWSTLWTLQDVKFLWFLPLKTTHLRECMFIGCAPVALQTMPGLMANGICPPHGSSVHSFFVWFPQWHGSPTVHFTTNEWNGKKGSKSPQMWGDWLRNWVVEASSGTDADHEERTHQPGPFDGFGLEVHQGTFSGTRDVSWCNPLRKPII